MIVEEITLRNWRGYRQARTFNLGEGLNLLVGRNEAGKSTLFEALTRAMFDRHTTRTEEIRAMQPLGSTLGPEAEVVFRVGGRRHRAVKRFLQSPRSQLFAQRAGEWELDHEGDEADARLRELLAGDPASRSARAEHRGLAEALWYLQSDDPLPSGTWNDGLQEGLESLLRVSVRTPQEGEILAGIQAAFRATHTPTGRIAGGSVLGSLQAGIPELEESVAKLRDAGEEAERYRTDLVEFEGAREAKEDALRKARSDVADAERALAEASQLERERERLEHEVESAARRARELEGAEQAIDRRNQRVLQLEGALAAKSGTLEGIEASLRQEALAAERHSARWRSEEEPALRRIEASLSANQALAEARRLEKEGERLRSRIELANAARLALKAKEQEIEAIRAPSSAAWKSFQVSLGELRVVEAKASASAIRVAFDLAPAASGIASSPPAPRSPEGDEYVVTEPTTFTLEGIGTVRVRGGGGSLAELHSQALRLRSEVEETLKRFEAADEQELADRHQRKRDGERERKALEARVKEIESGDEDLERELRRAESALKEERTRASALLPEAQAWSPEALRDHGRDLRAQREGLQRAIEEEQKREKEARDAHLKLVGDRSGILSAVVALRSEIRSLREENARAIAPYGTVTRLRDLLDEARARLREAEGARAVALKDYESRVETPRRLHAHAMERVETLEDQLEELREQIVDRLARIEQLAASGSYTQLADLEVQLAAKRRRLAVLAERADASRLLMGLASAFQEEQTKALAPPVASLLDRWIRILTDDAYDEIHLDAALLPAGAHSVRYDGLLPLESLSHGTREQIIVLLRLAIGVLLSKEERHLVIVDDRLVNADAVRMSRLCLILQEAAGSCQIVVATCNDTPYAGLDARTVRVPEGSRRPAEPALDAATSSLLPAGGGGSGEKLPNRLPREESVLTAGDPVAGFPLLVPGPRRSPDPDDEGPLQRDSSPGRRLKGGPGAYLRQGIVSPGEDEPMERDVAGDGEVEGVEPPREGAPGRRPTTRQALADLAAQRSRILAALAAPKPIRQLADEMGMDVAALRPVLQNMRTDGLIEVVGQKRLARWRKVE